MAGDDRLSDLPDDLLRCILNFAPAKEGAMTSALARRWRSLWPSYGTVNLDSRSYDHLDSYLRRLAIVRDAKNSLAAADGGGFPVTKLTFWYVEGADDPLGSGNIGSYYDDMHEGLRDMSEDLRAMLYGPASRHLEELRLGLFFGPRHEEETYDLSIPDLSSSPVLRVLHLSQWAPMETVREWGPRRSYRTPSFPRLVELRLHLCWVLLHVLQGAIDAAPLLATLQLDGVDICLRPMKDPPATRSLHLRCPKVTSLVLVDFKCWGRQGKNTMELDAPLLRCFAYKGPPRSLSFKLRPPDMTRVDLSFQVPAAQVGTDNRMCRLFWKFIHNFSGANTHGGPPPSPAFNTTTTPPNRGGYSANMPLHVSSGDDGPAVQGHPVITISSDSDSAPPSQMASPPAAFSASTDIGSSITPAIISRPLPRPVAAVGGIMLTPPPSSPDDHNKDSLDDLPPPNAVQLPSAFSPYDSSNSPGLDIDVSSIAFAAGASSSGTASAQPCLPPSLVFQPDHSLTMVTPATKSADPHLHECVLRKLRHNAKRSADKSMSLRRSSRLAAKEPRVFTNMATKAIRARAKRLTSTDVAKALKDAIHDA
ncbi:hypothetical protein CFC21_042413 [Triticum aestivum]|uniref:F-box domain-containing protein n=2 Tax=Triticum aestivum TaxID=4565 RepID=A0A3B6FUW8_WHEAT|nr:hypothetical protein CFC21_042413 [Triticum aestivum]